MATAQAAALSMDSAYSHLNDISAVYALANTIFTTTALDIFKEARTAAHTLRIAYRITES